MKKIHFIKKLMMVLGCLFILGVTAANADTQKPVTLQQLPATSQQFIKTHFPNDKISLATVERDFLETTYKVLFTNGSKVEFIRNGEWEEVNCKYASVPVAIIPEAINAKIKDLYPDAKVLQIEKDSRGYEVKLSNNLELTFTTDFTLIDIDD